ncbi:MAG: hypothetical protein ACJAT2_000618 [Bacteriovoracaceae bacterium]|jgi:hypothetical protein
MQKLLILIFLLPSLCFAQGLGDGFSIEEDDLQIGGDIFTDFNEDVEEAQVLEDERFFRYGRFFSFAISLGLTTFDGNRGTAYENDPPSYGLSVYYFSDFFNSFGMGFEYSKHHFFADQPTFGFTVNAPGLIEINILRVFFGYRYYIDTANLGTAITYSNPYFIGRIEYWYLTNKFIDQSALADDSGGGLGFGAGFGLEFPIKLKESYIGTEFLFHSVNLHDKFTQNYRPLSEGQFGFDDLTGNAYSLMISYTMGW